jgi:phosphatidate cytidylyltransferase
MSRNLVARILVAAVAIPAILWVSYRGGWWLLGMISLFALVAISEFLISEGFPPKGGVFWLGFGATLLLLMVMTDVDFVQSVYPASLLGENSTALGLVVVMLFYMVTAMIFAVGKLPPAELFKRHSRLVWGVLYVGLLYPIVFKVGGGFSDISGGNCLLFLFGVLWIGDTVAMGIGSWLGKRQLAPAVSPRKTVEGFFGGIIGAAAVGTLMYFWKFQSLSFIEVLVLAIGCSIFGQLGDLVESMWKRSLDIKDSSNIIPGHGGVLDRFDSLLFAGPFMYAFFHLVRT